MDSTWQWCWNIGQLPFHRQGIDTLLQINYSRTPPCVYPSFVDSPSLWTLVLLQSNTPSSTTVDTSLLWTLFVRPLAVHIGEVLLYLVILHCISLLITQNISVNHFAPTNAPRYNDIFKASDLFFWWITDYGIPFFSEHDTRSTMPPSCTLGLANTGTVLHPATV